MSNDHVHPFFGKALESICDPAPPEYDDGARWRKLVRIHHTFEPDLALCQWDPTCKEWIPVVWPERTMDQQIHQEIEKE